MTQPDAKARAAWEKVDLDSSLQRLEERLHLQGRVGSRELGVVLALHLARELRDKVEVGSRTGEIIALWMEEHPASVVEEAVGFAREFLLHPSQIREGISRKLFNE